MTSAAGFVGSRGRLRNLPGTIAFIAFVATASIVFGLVAVTANPIVIGVTGGLLAGSILLVQPVWNIWLVLLLGLLVAGIVPIWADALASRAVWGISVLGFLLMFAALYRLATVPGTARDCPTFVWVAIAFMVYVVANSLLQWYSAYETLSGIKRYFQVFGLVLAFAYLKIEEKHIRRWQFFLLVVALIQLPWAIYERLVLLPIREGFRFVYPGMVPVDVVAGTFGASIREGGGNSEMATFLIVVFAFMLSRWREGLLSFSKVAVLSPFVLAPLFLGETKIVVILLPLVFFGLYRRELFTRPHRAIAALAIASVLTAGAIYTYLAINKMTLREQVEETLSYNVFERGHGLYKLNRTKVLTFWAERQSLSDPVSTVFGHGLGAAHDKTAGHVSVRYLGYGIGLTAASTLLWEQGLFGMALYLSVILLAWRTAWRIRTTSQVSWMRADAAAIEAALPLFAVYVFYRLTLLEHLPFQIVFAMVLGYLAWLAQREARMRRSLV